MKHQNFAWIAIGTLIVVLTIATAYQSYFPGDIAIAQGLQFLEPENNAWAKWITNTAQVPWRFWLLAIAFVLAWFISGWNAALLSIFMFTVMFELDLLIKPWIARPRPDPTLVNIPGMFNGYSFPSTLAVVYASTFGFLAILALVSRQRSLSTRLATFIPCFLLLIVGGTACVVLGKHWPSDIILTYLIGGFLTTLLIQLFNWGPEKVFPRKHQ